MTTKTEICNIALGRIGHESVLNVDTEDSPEAKYCRRFYDVARRAVLREHDWSFATVTVALPTLADIEVEGWDYVYGYPNDCLRIQNIVGDKIPYEVQLVDSTRVICTNEEDIYLRYTQDVSNAALFDSLFVEMFAWRIAQDLAMPLSRDSNLLKYCIESYRTGMAQAKTYDSAEHKEKEEWEASWVSEVLNA